MVTAIVRFLSGHTEMRISWLSIAVLSEHHRSVDEVKYRTGNRVVTSNCARHLQCYGRICEKSSKKIQDASLSTAVWVTSQHIDPHLYLTEPGHHHHHHHCVHLL